MKNTNVEIVGINVDKKENGEFEHTVVSRYMFESFEQAGRMIDQKKLYGRIFIGIEG